METAVIVIIAIVVVVVIAGGIAVAARSSLLPGRRTTRLKKHFGPEYDHAVEAHGSETAAENDLSERLRRREHTKLRELTDQERRAHDDAWTSVQQEFVDAPERAVHQARGMVESVMADVGYPDGRTAPDSDEGFEQRLRELSVDHPAAVAEFRRVHGAGRRDQADRTGTEYLREELVTYRGLVDALLGGPSHGGHRTTGDEETVARPRHEQWAEERR